MPKTPVCSICGSDDIKVDAWAEWSYTEQCWILSDTYESEAFCETCEGGTSIDWEEPNTPGGNDED